MIKRIVPFFFVLLVVMVITSCATLGVKPKQLVTVKLLPTEVQTMDVPTGDDAANHTSGAVCVCGLQNLGGSCDSNSFMLTPEPMSLLVGYENWYVPGTQPCACWAWADCIWRGYVKFDLGSLPTTDVVSAQLKWKSSAKVHYASATNETWCLIKLYVAEEAWTKYKIAGEQVGSGGYITSPVDVQMGGIVRDWAKGVRPNYGLYFVGPNEKQETDSKSQCRTQIFGLELEVTVSK